MGFMQRFLKDADRAAPAPRRQSSFQNVSEDQLEAHLNIARYGDFILTDAVRPAYDLEIVPQAGYRRDSYRDRDTGVAIPVLMAAASREQVLDVFFDLLDPLGTEVDVVLETSHEATGGRHQDLYREHIDLPVLKSILYDYEDLLLDDGCTGIAVLNPSLPLEVQFDEHKLLILYGHDLEEFEQVLANYGLEARSDMRFITEGEHVHSSTEEFARQFEELRYRLGVDD